MEHLIGKLRQADLITHLIEIDGDMVQEKTAAAVVLTVLDAQVFRIGPHLYGVDLSGLECQCDEDKIDAVTDALSRQMGAGSVKITKLADVVHEQRSEMSDLDHNVLVLLRTMGTASKTVAGQTEPGACALLNAEFAVRTAELTAKGVANLDIPASGRQEETLRALADVNEALTALQSRIEQLEQRIGTITAVNRDSLRDVAETALRRPLEALASRIVPRLEALEQGQLPAEWFLGQIMSRIGDLDDQLSDSGAETRAAAMEWAKRLDDQISAVADQLIPPEWFLGRIMTRIGELDRQLAGSEQEIRAVAEEWAGALDARLTTLAHQAVPPEWLLGKLLTRLDRIEQGLHAVSPGAMESVAGNDEPDHRPDPAHTVSVIEDHVAAFVQRQDAINARTEESMRVIRTALAELLSR